MFEFPQVWIMNAHNYLTNLGCSSFNRLLYFLLEMRHKYKMNDIRVKHGIHFDFVRSCEELHNYSFFGFKVRQCTRFNVRWTAPTLALLTFQVLRLHAPLVFFGVRVLHRHERRWSEAEVVASSVSCIDSFHLGRNLVVACRMSQMWNG